MEMDELWTFVGKKKQARWLWIALERRVLEWVLGDRSEATAFRLWERLPLSPEQRLKGPSVPTSGLPTTSRCWG